MLKSFVALSTLALALTACSKDDSSADAQLLSAGPAEHVVDGHKTRKMKAGRYLVTIKQPGMCLGREINLKQTISYPNSNPSNKPSIIIAADGDVYDNLMRPAVCMPNVIDSGRTVVEFHQEFTLKAGDAAGKISLVERIDETVDAKLTESRELAKGQYLVRYSKPGVCMAWSFTVRKSYEYGETLDSVLVKAVAGERIYDNLIRPAVCMAPEGVLRDTAVSFEDFRGAAGKLDESAEAGLTVESAEQIIRKTKV